MSANAWVVIGPSMSEAFKGSDPYADPPVWIGQMDQRTYDIMASASQYETQQSVYRPQTVNGQNPFINYSIRNATVEGLNDDIAYLNANWAGNQFAVDGAWDMSTGLQVGLTRDEETGEILGDPTYPLDPDTYQIMPLIIVPGGQGPELWTDPPTSLDDWVDEGDGVYSLDGSQTTNQFMRMLDIATPGSTYTTTFTVSNRAAGNVTVRYGSENALIIAENGVHTVTALCDGTEIALRSNTSTNLRVSNVSIVEELPDTEEEVTSNLGLTDVFLYGSRGGIGAQRAREFFDNDVFVVNAVASSTDPAILRVRGTWEPGSRVTFTFNVTNGGSGTFAVNRRFSTRLGALIVIARLLTTLNNSDASVLITPTIVNGNELHIVADNPSHTVTVSVEVTP